MKNLYLLIVGLIILPIVAAVAQTSDWIGTLQTTDKPSPIRLRLEQHGKETNGSLFVPSERILMTPIAAVHQDDERISFSVKTMSAEYKFTAKITGSQMTGEMTSEDKKLSFQMLRLAQVNKSKYFGIYRFADSHYVYIRTWDELGPDQLTYITDEGLAGPLYPSSAISFFSGPSLMIPLPQELKVTFVVNNKNEVTDLKWEDKTGKEKSAKKIALSEEEVEFSDANVKLAGSLVLPNGKKPFPALVLVHGSGPVTRDFFGPIAYLFANHGIAVLSYDKRGNGKSEGDWLETGFDVLADDVLAAVTYLKSRKEIDASHIGLFGVSQGGWIIPLAAAKSKDVAFAVLVSAPAVSPLTQDETRTREELRLAGSSEEEINKAISDYKNQMDGLMSDEGLQWVQSEIKKAKDAGNTELLSANGPENPRFLLWLRTILHYDPLPALEKMKCPVLAVYGELDRGVTVADNRNLLESTLKKGGTQDVTVVILPNADHALIECKTGSASEFPYLHRFVPGFFETVLHWVSKHAE
ncbi:MAG: hypothetical protein C5B54_08325 [Acidobacteria bacterium]|nr:MAG: hypothetical protein C5B54_08325 [Acidobacteriota bacterium]